MQNIVVSTLHSENFIPQVVRQGFIYPVLYIFPGKICRLYGRNSTVPEPQLPLQENYYKILRYKYYMVMAE